jgi:23S rRNA (adenine2503-C2)-methyltransferase
MLNWYDVTQDDLAALIQGWGQPSFRTKQVWGWLYERLAASVEDMTDLPKPLREKLRSEGTIGTLELVTGQQSKDGTEKRLYRLPDGRLIESVLMVYEDGRRTACISTQSGCAMGCVFCATGQMGFFRHLTATEIVEQALAFARELNQRGERLSNVVLMGMGEPFHNYDASLSAIRRLINDLGIGARHITVSTVGLVPQIRQFAEEGLQVTLAISLHAANDTARGALLPVNRRWPLSDLIAACHHYVKKTGRRVTFEWALIHGQTDTQIQAHELAKLLRGMLCHVNVIPLNPTRGFAGSPSEIAAANNFIAILHDYNISATVRIRRGIDIDAGCGQLTTRYIQPNDIPSVVEMP